MQERVLITLVLAAFTAVYIAANLGRIRRLPGAYVLLSAIGALYLGWVFSLVDTSPDGVLNIFEHGLYCAYTVLVALWSYRIFARREPEP